MSLKVPIQLRLRRKDKIVETWTKLYLNFFDSRIATKPEQRARTSSSTQRNHFIHWTAFKELLMWSYYLSSNRVIWLFRHRLEEAIPAPRRANGRAGTYGSAKVKGKKLSTFFKLPQQGSKSNSLFPSFFPYWSHRDPFWSVHFHSVGITYLSPDPFLSLPPK